MRLIIEEAYSTHPDNHFLLKCKFGEGIDFEEGYKELESGLALQKMRKRAYVFGEYGQPKMQDKMSAEQFLLRCMQIDESKICILFKSIDRLEEGIRVYCSAVGPLGSTFIKSLKANEVDLGTRDQFQFVIDGNEVKQRHVNIDVIPKETKRENNYGDTTLVPINGS